MSLLIDHVTKHYIRASHESNVYEALHETTLELTPGTVIEICGRSGGGKSTLLNMAAGLLSPTTGKVMLDDQDLYSLDDATLSALRNEKIGVVPQAHSALSSLTVLENVLLPLELYGLHDNEDLAHDLLRSLGIAELAEVFPSELSGGEARRMMIARSLIRSPQILLADEPTGDLDDETTDVVLDLLRTTADSGCAVLLVTHEPSADRIANTVYRMNSGTLQAI